MKLGNAEDFDDDALSALTVKLGVEDALPCAEIELAIGDGQCGFVMQEKGLEVGVAIVLACAVVLVVRTRGRQLFQPFSDVLNKSAFEVVNVDGRGDVHRGDKTETVAHAAALNNLLYVIGDVDHLAALLGFKDEVLGVAFQWGLP